MQVASIGMSVAVVSVEVCGCLLVEIRRRSVVSLQVVVVRTAGFEAFLFCYAPAVSHVKVAC